MNLDTVYVCLNAYHLCRYWSRARGHLHRRVFLWFPKPVARWAHSSREIKEHTMLNGAVFQFIRPTIDLTLLHVLFCTFDLAPSGSDYNAFNAEWFLSSPRCPSCLSNCHLQFTKKILTRFLLQLKPEIKKKWRKWMQINRACEQKIRAHKNFKFLFFRQKMTRCSHHTKTKTFKQPSWMQTF